MNKKPYFPMFVDLSEKKIVVAGGGTIALRRIKTLLAFAEEIHVIAPRITPELQELALSGQITEKRRPVKMEDLEDADMVIAATDDHLLNDEICRYCRERGICVNVVSDKEKCDFFFPGVILWDEMVIGVTASGKDHKKTRQIREKMERLLADDTGENRYDE